MSCQAKFRRSVKDSTILPSMIAGSYGPTQDVTIIISDVWGIAARGVFSPLFDRDSDVGIRIKLYLQRVPNAIVLRGITFPVTSAVALTGECSILGVLTSLIGEMIAIK